MIKNLIRNLKNNKSNEKPIEVYDTEESSVVIPMLDEYSLMVRNDRIVDCSKYKTEYSLDVRFGFYQDTYQYLTENRQDQAAGNNIHQVLCLVARYYREILSENYGVNTTQSFIKRHNVFEFARLQKLFVVNGLQLSNSETSQTLCLNLLVRPEVEPFIAIGKRPKGKLSSVQQDK